MSLHPNRQNESEHGETSFHESALSLLKVVKVKLGRRGLVLAP